MCEILLALTVSIKYSYGSSTRGNKKTIKDLEKKYYPLFRAAKFAIAGVVGFLVVEAILVAGVFAIYDTTKVPSIAFSSPTILALYILAFAVGVTVAFFINERVTVHNLGEQKNKSVSKVVIRLLKFQLGYLLGNVINILVALALLAYLSLSPVYGNIIGAIVAYPISYLISMRIVWKLDALGKSPYDNFSL